MNGRHVPAGATPGGVLEWESLLVDLYWSGAVQAATIPSTVSSNLSTATS